MAMAPKIKKSAVTDDDSDVEFIPGPISRGLARPVS